MALLGVFLGMGWIYGVASFLGSRGSGGHADLAEHLIWEISGWLSGFILLPIPLAAFLNAPWYERRWGHILGIHTAAYALFAGLVPPLFLVIRHLAYSVLELGAYNYGRWDLLLPMEWLKVLIWYLIMGGIWTLYVRVQAGRQSQLREAELRGQLQEARLQALSAQLDPHFLFNALNTISSVMYEDLRRTDHLLASLGQMLRDGLATEGPWDLAREVRHLEAYLDFAVARFGDRLRMELHVKEGLGARPVPRYCLQRLVENALKHNLDQTNVLQVQVMAYSQGRALVLEVRDDGRGFSDTARSLVGAGTGLRNLRETLALQFGPEATLEVINPREGGARVRMRLSHG